MRRRGAVLLLGLSTAAGLHVSQPLATRTRLPMATCALRMMCSDGDLSRFTVLQLKEKLRSRGLPVSGRKAELIARLLPAAQDQTTTIPETVSKLLDSMALSFPNVEIEACRS